MAAKLNVTIIGAGLSGLAAARVLRENHKVTILERNCRNSEIGAALSLGPTATKLVEELGFDRERAKALTWVSTRTLTKDGNVVSEQDMRKFAKHTDADFLMIHRVDLWNELFRLATASSPELGIGGEPAEIVWGANVVDVDVDSGSVVLEDGPTFNSDLVVGADGIRSILRPLVVGENAFCTARPSGQSAFRFTMPLKQALNLHPDIYNLDVSRHVTNDLYLSMDGTNRSLVMYPCRNHELVNFVCIIPDSLVGETTESWTAEGTREELLRCYEDFCQMLKDLLSHAEDIKLWQLRDQDPLPSYVKGRTVIIGDAAHAMAPHQAQGGTQAVEDSDGFRLFTSVDVTRCTVPNILKDFDRVRRQRASQVQNNTRASLDRRPEIVFKGHLYNSTYGGVKTCLRRLDEGKEMIPV